MLLKNTNIRHDLFSYDHKRPLSKGGGQDINNVVTCCMTCNILKNDMSYETFSKMITFIPHHLFPDIFAEIWFRNDALKAKLYELQKLKIKYKVK